MNEASQPSRFLTPPLSPLRIEPVTLSGQYVTLEPLREGHLAGLCAFGFTPEIWQWVVAPVRNEAEMHAYISQAILEESRGHSLPFATLYSPTQTVVGSTRYMNIDLKNRHLEIGSTFVSPEWQRSPINREAKYLLLAHAFETLGCLRVEFKTDSLNAKSRQALAGIGAVEEGIFRNHMICADGRVRHSVYFSITDEEWPHVKAHLQRKLNRPFVPPRE